MLTKHNNNNLKFKTKLTHIYILLRLHQFVVNIMKRITFSLTLFPSLIMNE